VIGNFNANPRSTDGTCSVTFDADIADSSGVASASVEWETFDVSGMPTGFTGAKPMSLFAGTVISGTWRAVFTLTNLPSYGRLEWKVQATDIAANTSLAPSNIPISAGPNGCP